MINKAALHALDPLFERAISEDLGDGDHTSLACIPERATGRAVLKAKENGIVAGLSVAKYLFSKFDAQLKVLLYRQDGDTVVPGDPIFTVEGKVRSILTAERTVLNFIQRLSGIATQTAQYVAIAAKYDVEVADTRKTTPGYRILEKAAVQAGGGRNHRMGLYDLILIKDNHIDFAGGIAGAVSRARQYLEETGRTLKIEVETRNPEEVEQALATGAVDIIMLDNFSPEECQRAVQVINGQCEVEASGNIDLNNLEAYAAAGIDYVSSGALTHSAKGMDMSLVAEF